MRPSTKIWGVLAAVCFLAAAPEIQDTSGPLTGPLTFGAFVIEFHDGGEFRLEGQGWPAFVGSWKVSGLFRAW
jgi:hypothetical protein